MNVRKRTTSLVLAIVVIVGSIVALERVLPKSATPLTRAGSAEIDISKVGASEKDGPALPELVGISQWINSEPLKTQDLRGKVVVVDFWTYSCVNCLRTLPYLKQWHDKYADRGLVIIGVHTPEFEFEKNVTNVRNAVRDLGVSWPVAMDNDYGTWDAYANRYWPHKYLADAQGRLRYHHIGEGDYDQIEQEIRELLTEAGRNIVDVPLGQVANQDEPEQEMTREIYAGKEWALSGFLGNQALAQDGAAGTYEDTGDYKDGQFTLQGTWDENQEYLRQKTLTAGTQAWVALKYSAKEANAVLDVQDAERVIVEVQLNGKPLPKDLAGDDVSYDASGRSLIIVNGARMYRIVKAPAVQQNELRLTPQAPGLVLYTFTFTVT